MGRVTHRCQRELSLAKCCVQREGVKVVAKVEGIEFEKFLAMEEKQNGVSDDLLVVLQQEGDSDVGGAMSMFEVEVLKVLEYERCAMKSEKNS